MVSAKVIYILRRYSPSRVSMKRLACILLIVTILFSGLFLIQNAYAQINTGLTISGNTEWTMAQSPINLNGTLTVSNNVTLTIDPGVTVNMGMYPFYVYGTLIAQGSANNQIVFTSASNQSVPNSASVPIYIGQYSTYTNGLNNPESIIQYAVLNGVAINVNGVASSELDSCTFNYGAPYQAPITTSGSSPQISNNVINLNGKNSNGGITGIDVYGGTPQIINNQFEGSLPNPINVGSTNVGIYVSSGSPIIHGNSFAAQYGNNSDGIKVTSGTPLITNNQFQGSGWLIGVEDSSSAFFTISNNEFSSCYMGVNAQTGCLLNIQGNQFLDGTDGVDISGTAQVAVTGNLIDGNSRYGINGGGTIGSNTISNNQIGIHNPPLGNINNNNIVGNTLNSITATTSDIDAQNNWWGIADTATINRTIYDSKVDPHLGTIQFAPFLTGPSTSAPAIPNDTPTITPIPITQAQLPQVTPTPQPVYTPTPTPDQYSHTFEYQVGSMMNLNLVTTATAVVLALVWVVVVLGYAVKRGISKHRTKN